MADSSQGHHRRRSLALVNNGIAAHPRNSTSAVSAPAVAAPAPASSPVRKESGTSSRRPSQHVHRKHRRERDHHHTLVGGSDDNDDGVGSDFSSRSTSDDVEMKDMLSDDALDDDEETGLTHDDRRRRRRRKRQKSRLDARVVKDSKAPKAIKLSSADQSVLRRSIVNVSLIGCWYLFSLSISIYNKWMFSPDHLNFHFPLFTTCLHMLVQFSLAALVLYMVPRFRPRHDSLSRPQGITSSTHPTTTTTTTTSSDRPPPSDKPLMTKRFYITRIGPCAAATGLDIGLGNMSLKFITLTFYTMCKSSSLAFVLLFAFLFRLESPSVKLVLIIFTMTVGVIMMVAGETAFNALGFVLVISASFFSGFRWALTQILLLRNPATSNPFSSIFFLAPIMFVSLLVIALPVEGVSSLAERLSELFAVRGIFLGIGILLFPGLLAFLMTTSEFALLQRTSVVTLSICGIFKEVVTIAAAGIAFHDHLTMVNLAGLVVTIGSIAAYNWLKIVKMRHEARVVEVQRRKNGELDLQDGGQHSPSAAAAAAVDDDDEGREEDRPREQEGLLSGHEQEQGQHVKRSHGEEQGTGTGEGGIGLGIEVK